MRAATSEPTVARVIYAGKQKLRIPKAWTTFCWHERRYRLSGPIVEVFDQRQARWLPSIRLTTAAPKGRAA